MSRGICEEIQKSRKNQRVKALREQGPAVILEEEEMEAERHGF